MAVRPGGYFAMLSRCDTSDPSRLMLRQIPRLSLNAEPSCYDSADPIQKQPARSSNLHGVQRYAAIIRGFRVLDPGFIQCELAHIPH